MATNDDRIQNKIKPYIIEQINYCILHQCVIRAHLEECREWDAFPTTFLNDTDTQQADSELDEKKKSPFDLSISFALGCVIQNIERIYKTTDTLRRAYCNSGYIDHQPVAIDFLDCLIEIASQLYDTLTQLSKATSDST